MDTKAKVADQAEKENPVFKTPCMEITKGASLFLDIGRGKIGKDKKEHLGFSPLKPTSYSGTFTRTEPPILVLRIANPKQFKPKMVGERWKVRVEDMEITSELTRNKQFQKVLVRLSVLGRVENSSKFYDKEKEQYVIETRSGRATIRKEVFETEEETQEYRGEQRGQPMVFRVRSVYPIINGARGDMVSQTLILATNKFVLVGEKASQITRETLKAGGHGNTR
ncbi:MAG: hypothetical protein HZC04_00140 [Candidatus Lloydbacteria bacterium]|nr:hypothetical protein [Candidatus Lloydbacteria bacterium]